MIDKYKVARGYGAKDKLNQSSQRHLEDGGTVDGDTYFDHLEEIKEQLIDYWLANDWGWGDLDEGHIYTREELERDWQDFSFDMDRDVWIDFTKWLNKQNK